MSVIISILVFLPIIGAFLIFFIDRKNYIQIKCSSILITFFNFLISIFLWVLFDKSTGFFQFSELYIWENCIIFFGVDGISIFFIILSIFLVSLCMLFYENLNYLKEYMICFLVIESFLIILFSTLNLLVFFVFFESILVPLFIIIGLLGSGRRKIRSGYFFFFYTFIGSILMLFSIIFIFLRVGTFDFQVLASLNLNLQTQNILWFGFILAFLTKIPVIPFHLWLPEAHVEAPTGGSVLLAGILLKLGTYGILRFLIPLFNVASVYNIPLIYALGGISIIYSSGTAIRQTDLKRVIAYTSIAHMNLIFIGLFSFSITSLIGSLFQMLSHGFVSSALFFCIGCFYNRYHTRIIENYGGLVQILPMLSIYFFIFTLANIAFPGTSNFIGEVLLFIGIFENNFFITFISILSLVFSGAYSLWVYNRVCFGNLKTTYNYPTDLSLLEFFILFILLFFTIFLGCFPKIITDTVLLSSQLLLEL